MNVNWAFKLYLVATPRDTRGDADQVYTAHAVADWSFNASGGINAGNGFAWTAQQGGGITSPTGWTELNEGTRPAATAGKKFNPLLRSTPYEEAP
jgi:hypothetical protein